MEVTGPTSRTPSTCSDLFKTKFELVHPQTPAAKRTKMVLPQGTKRKPVDDPLSRGKRKPGEGPQSDGEDQGGDDDAQLPGPEEACDEELVREAPGEDEPLQIPP